MTGASPSLTTKDKEETERQKEEDIDKSDKSLQWRKLADYTSLSNKRHSRHTSLVCFGILNHTLYELSTESLEIQISLTFLSSRLSPDIRIFLYVTVQLMAVLLDGTEYRDVVDARALLCGCQNVMVSC